MNWRLGGPLAVNGCMATASSDRGFTLFETLIATGVLITALAGVAQLFVLGSRLARRTTASGVALLAAQNKLETLRGLTYGFNEYGIAETSADLEISDERSLNASIPSYFDWLDPNGEPLEEADEAAFVRRWRITPFDTQVPEAITIEVCVFAATTEKRDTSAADACLSTMRTRQP